MSLRAYTGTVDKFYNDLFSGMIVEEIQKQTKMNFNHSQIMAFQNSLPYVESVLRHAGIPLDIDVAIEMRVPLRMMRMDFVIAGADEYDKDHVIIIELKQWSKVRHTDMPSIVDVDMTGRGFYEQHVHPSWQVYTYEATIKNFNEYIWKNDVDIQSCAFLHNYERKYIDELEHPIYEEGIKKAKPYIYDEQIKLSSFIQKLIKKKSKNNLLFEIVEGRCRPSKKLADCLGSTLNGNHDFDLMGQQIIVFENLYKEISQQKNDGSKKVYIVRGGMGTGKTLVAIHLLSKLIKNKGMSTFFVAKSGYLKESYVSKLTRNVPNFQFLRSLFAGSGNFMNSMSNEVDCLLVDEAHRLTQKTKRGHLYLGENQIKEIINAAKSTVFFIDPSQQIDIKDFGTIENIKKYANELNAEVIDDPKYVLKDQFRCNGSDEYLAFVESLLYNKEFIPTGEKVDYEIEVFDDLEEMHKAIIQKNQDEGTSRMLSGDVFPWLSMKDKQAIDINIGNFHAQWNKTRKFAVDPNSINEVGCIHTSQGMDFQYVGLIVGEDLIYRDNKVETDYTKHPSGSGEFKRPHQRKVFAEDLDKIDTLIRNTYKVLFTRGLKGLYLYIMDSELKKFVKARIDYLKELDK